MTRNCRRYRRHGGYVHAGFAVSLVIGGLVGTSYLDGPTPAERRQQERCEPVSGADLRSRDLLTDAGWQAEGNLIYPPGCEAQR